MNDILKTLIIIAVIALLIVVGVNFVVRRTKRFLRRKINSISQEMLGVSAQEVRNIISTAGTIQEMVSSEEEIKPKSIGGATNVYLKQIERDFPDFHNSDAEVALKTFLTEYLGIQYEGKGGFTKSSVDKGIIDLIEKQNNTDIKNIDFNKFSISGYKKSDEYATITYQVSIGYDENQRRIETRYKIDYTLRLANNNIATKAMICPNCGGAIESTSEVKCPYCDTKIIRDTIFNWIFTSIKEY